MDKSKETTYSFPNEFATSKEKADEKYGLDYAKAIWWEANDLGRTFYTNQDKLVELRLWAEGMQSIDHLKDQYFGGGDDAYISLNLNVATPIQKLINSFQNDITSREYDIVVYTIDKLSKSEKDKELNKRLAGVKIARKLKELEDAGEDTTKLRKVMSKQIDFDSLPDTEDDVYFDMEYNHKSPFAEALEAVIDWVFDKNNIGRIKATIARDLGVIKSGGFHCYLDEKNEIVIDDIDLKNIITSYCKKDDYSDARYIAYVKEMPIYQLKALAGDKFTDEEYFQMAKNNGEKFGNKRWAFGSYFGEITNDFSSFANFNVLVMPFQFKTTEGVKKKYVEKKRGSKYVDKVDEDYEIKEKENGELISNERVVIYEGWYVVNTDFIFRYRKKPNVIRELRGRKHSTDTCFDIELMTPNMLDMRTKSLVEQMIPFAEEMILTELKLQHLISKLRPDGLIVDLSAISGISSAMGKRFLSYADLQEIYDQTGTMYMKSMSSSGQAQLANNSTPIKEITNSAGLQKLESLFAIYNQYMEKIYQVTGFNPSMDGSIPEKGSLVGISELNIKGYNNSVKHLYDAFTHLMSRMAYRVAVMTQDKIGRGEDIVGYKRAFGTRYVDSIKLSGDYTLTELGMGIEYRPTLAERQDLLEAIKLSLKDGIIGASSYMRVIDISKKNLKQAERYLKKEEQKFRENKMKEQEALAEQNRMAQLEAPKAAAEAQAMVKQVEYKLKSELSAQEHAQELEKIRLQHGMLKTQSQILQGEIDKDLIEVSQGEDDDNDIGGKLRVGNNDRVGSSATGTAKAPMPRVNKIPQDNAITNARV